MYLSKKTYIGGNYEHNNVTGSIDLRKGKDNIPVVIDLKRLTYIEEEVGYWRKANHIHKWFVDNVQDGKDDCGTYEVTDEQLTELLSICKRVKEATQLKDSVIKNGEVWENGIRMPVFEDGKVIVNPEIAKELLPTASGFFFGGTNYDEWYMKDIDNTINVIEKLMTEKEPGKDYINGDIYYHSSW